MARFGSGKSILVASLALPKQEKAIPNKEIKCGLGTDPAGSGTTGLGSSAELAEQHPWWSFCKPFASILFLRTVRTIQASSIDLAVISMHSCSYCPSSLPEREKRIGPTRPSHDNLPFIVTTSTQKPDKADRKKIRSHVMRGKNRRKHGVRGSRIGSWINPDDTSPAFFMRIPDSPNGRSKSSEPTDKDEETGLVYATQASASLSTFLAQAGTGMTYFRYAAKVDMQMLGHIYNCTDVVIFGSSFSLSIDTMC